MLTRYPISVGKFTSWLILLGVPVFAALVLFDEFGTVQLPYQFCAFVFGVVFSHGAWKAWYTPEDA